MRTLVVAPHPDDEILGCGGTLLRRKAESAELGWLIVTGISEETGWLPKNVAAREAEISQISEFVGFDHVFNLRLPTAQLDSLPLSSLIEQFSTVFTKFEPEEVFLPNCSDAHTDHRIVFEAGKACTKWFRFPSVRRVLTYETLSETDFNLNAENAFHPNYFIDISGYLETKLKMMAIYKSEIGDFPFPRSMETIRALAILRGSASGFHAAEAFCLLRQRD